MPALCALSLVCEKRGVPDALKLFDDAVTIVLTLIAPDLFDSIVIRKHLVARTVQPIELCHL